MCTASQSDNEEKYENNFIVQSNNSYNATLNAGHTNQSSMQLIDQLSLLFSLINQLCQEQFHIICAVFPANTIPRVARQLIQRIFHDPAFGVQTRVDSILNPRPPLPPLQTADYLDALVIVREKLSALYLLLIECSGNPLMQGMGSESLSLRKSRMNIDYLLSSQQKSEVSNLHMSTALHPSEKQFLEETKSINTIVTKESGNGQYAYQQLVVDQDSEERFRSDAEIREFFDEQVGNAICRTSLFLGLLSSI